MAQTVTRGQEAEEIGHGQLVEFREGSTLPLPAQRLGLKSLARAVGAQVVGPVARKIDAHVHLVGVLFQPAEKPVHSVPVLGPGLAVLLAITGLAFDDEALLFGWQRREGHVGANLLLPGGGQQILLGFTVDLAFPAPNDAGLDR